MAKQSGAAGISLACFSSLSVLRGDRTPDCSGRSIDRSSAISGAGGVGLAGSS